MLSVVPWGLTTAGAHRSHPIKRYPENCNVRVNFGGIEDVGALQNVAMPVGGSEAAGRDAVIDFLECGWSWLDCRVSNRGIQF